MTSPNPCSMGWLKLKQKALDLAKGVNHPLPRHLLKGNENICPQKDLYKKIHYDFIHYSLKWETSPKLLQEENG